MTRPRSSSTLLYHPDLRMILNWITQLWREQGREPEIRVTSVCMLGILKLRTDISSIRYSQVFEREHQQLKFTGVYLFKYNIKEFSKLYCHYTIWVAKDVIHFPHQLWCTSRYIVFKYIFYYLAICTLTKQLSPRPSKCPLARGSFIR
jgi:hypothetical protein